MLRFTGKNSHVNNNVDIRWISMYKIAVTNTLGFYETLNVEWFEAQTRKKVAWRVKQISRKTEEYTYEYVDDPIRIMKQRGGSKRRMTWMVRAFSFTFAYRC